MAIVPPWRVIVPDLTLQRPLNRNIKFIFRTKNKRLLSLLIIKKITEILYGKNKENQKKRKRDENICLMMIAAVLIQLEESLDLYCET
jgi:hypothetical protein